MDTLNLTVQQQEETILEGKRNKDKRVYEMLEQHQLE